MCNSTLLRTKQLRLRLNFCEVVDGDGLRDCSRIFEASNNICEGKAHFAVQKKGLGWVDRMSNVLRLMKSLRSAQLVLSVRGGKNDL